MTYLLIVFLETDNGREHLRKVTKVVSEHFFFLKNHLDFFSEKKEGLKDSLMAMRIDFVLFF